MLPPVRPSVRPSRSVCFPVPFPHSVPFARWRDARVAVHTHSLGVSTVGYGPIQMLSAGGRWEAYRFSRYLFVFELKDQRWGTIQDHRQSSIHKNDCAYL